VHFEELTEDETVDTDVDRTWMFAINAQNQQLAISLGPPPADAVMSLPPPAAPTHLLRLHSQPITAFAFSEDSERLYSGDASGLVAVTSTRTLRPIANWQPHGDGILGVEEWQDEIVTYAGRPLFRSVPLLLQPFVFSFKVVMGGTTSCTFGSELSNCPDLLGWAMQLQV
jgi:hypothetical protein